LQDLLLHLALREQQHQTQLQRAFLQDLSHAVAVAAAALPCPSAAVVAAATAAVAAAMAAA
jgi:hypothetical protein